MKYFNSECDKCKWLYRVIEPKTRRVVGAICYLWYDASAGDLYHFEGQEHEHCFESNN